MISKIEETFLKSVLKEVNFFFDHKSIRRELQAHLEDLKEVYQAEDIDEEQLQAKIVEEMGDPKQIGRQLNQVHHPIIGWLWIASRLILIALALLLIGRLWLSFQTAYAMSRERSDTNLEMAGILSDYVSSEDPNGFKDIDLKERIHLNGYTIIIERILIHPEGVMAILYQEVKPFDLLIPYKPSHELQYHSKIRTNSGWEQTPETDRVIIQQEFRVLVFKDVPEDLELFTLEYTQVSQSFSLKLGVSQ